MIDYVFENYYSLLKGGINYRLLVEGFNMYRYRSISPTKSHATSGTAGPRKCKVEIMAEKLRTARLLYHIGEPFTIPVITKEICQQMDWADIVCHF